MTSIARGSAVALAGLSLTLAACGAGGASRWSLTTPGAHTGRLAALPSVRATPQATATPTPTATGSPRSAGPPVTATEQHVIRGWANALRAGDARAAAGYFTTPATVLVDPTTAPQDLDHSEVVAFNAKLECGAKLLQTRRTNQRYVVATFELTSRPGASCGSGTGSRAQVAFLIRHRRIREWLRLPDSSAPASPTPTPGGAVASGTA